MLTFYNPDGKPYEGTPEEVMEQIFSDASDPEKKIVKQDHLENGLFISTVWLECATKLPWEEHPKIYETVVFDGRTAREVLEKGLSSVLDRNQYDTRDDADRGHTEMLRKYIDWTPDDLRPDLDPETTL